MQSLIYAHAQTKIAQGDWQADHAAGVIRNRQGIPLGVRNSRGYRHIRIWYQGKRHDLQAHRVLFEHAHGPVPDGHHVHHRDADRLNNALINLEAVTPAMNTHYAALAGRLHTKLIASQVDEMRLRSLAGEHIMKIAADYGVSVRHTRDIVTGRSWGWLPWPTLAVLAPPPLDAPPVTAQAA